MAEIKSDADLMQMLQQAKEQLNRMRTHAIAYATLKSRIESRDLASLEITWALDDKTLTVTPLAPLSEANAITLATHMANAHAVELKRVVKDYNKSAKALVSLLTGGDEA